MDQPGDWLPKELPLGRLVADATGQLEQLEYSRRSLSRYRMIWEHLFEFSRQRGFGDCLSEDLATSFVQEYCIGDEEPDKPGQGWRRHIVFGVKVLVDFARYGRIERPRTEMKRVRVLPAMKRILDKYEQYCREKLFLRPWSLELRKRTLAVFLDFLRLKKVNNLQHLRARHLSEYVSSRSRLDPRTIARVCSDIRCFLRFLVMRGITCKDLSPEVPKIRYSQDAHIPSVWDQELIGKLLGAVDRSSVRGKRDYAILLLASRLGLRVGDIRTLRLDDIKWEDARIDIMQSKPKTLLSLPLTEEVGQALIDYLKSGRPPNSKHREIFLKLQPPFEPFSRNNLYHIVTYWRRLAGITFRTKQRRGLHSLRHSLATRLLEKGTPFHTISEILGHATSESTRIYAKADVEALRTVALDPEEVSHDK